MWLVIDTLELSGTSDSFPHSTENTIKTTNHTTNIFMTLCDHCPYFFRLPRSGSDKLRRWWSSGLMSRSGRRNKAV
jgi:hypothetical protein